MQTDFNPMHLKQVNDELDKLLSSSEQNKKHKDDTVKTSLWKKFLRLFKNNPFELPEDLYRYK